MHYREQLPAKFLEPFVENFYEFETTRDSPQFTVELMVPDSTNGFIFVQRHEMVRHTPHRANAPDRLSKSYLFGHKTKPVLYYFKNEQFHCFGVRLKPLGLGVFSPVPAHTLTDYFVEGQEVFGKEFAEVEDGIFNAVAFEEKVEVVQMFLAGLLKNSLFPHLQVLDRAIKSIYVNHGTLAVADLAASCHLSIKSLERLFLQRVGITPKLFQRIVRFNHAINRHYLNPNQSLTDITYHSGYYDQMHFVKEMKEFTSLSPTEYFNRTAEHKVEHWQQKLMSGRYHDSTHFPNG